MEKMLKTVHMSKSAALRAHKKRKKVKHIASRAKKQQQRYYERHKRRIKHSSAQ